MRRNKSFVPMSTIHRRMQATDDRFSAEQRRKCPELFTPRLVPVVEVALEPVPDQPAGPVVDVALVRKSEVSR